MALEVNKLSEGIRLEGINFGLPMTFVELGSLGGSYSADELIKEILTLAKCRWVCILGGNAAQVGMGALVKGLSGFGLRIEVESPDDILNPGWMAKANSWIVDYFPNHKFNYNSLRSTDSVRFRIKSDKDLEFLSRGLEDLKKFSGIRSIKVPSSEKILLFEVLSLVKTQDRCRIYPEIGFSI